MNKDFEKEYKKLIEEDPPELWDRIEKMVDAAIAEGTSADTEEKSEEESLLAAAVAEAMTEKPEEGADAGTDKSGEEKTEAGESGENDDAEDDEKKAVIVGAFGEAAAAKEGSDQADTGKKKKVFNWRRWVLPAAALLCVAIMIPVVIAINRDRTKTNAETMTSATAGAQSDSVMYDGADMSAMVQEAAEAGDTNSARGDERQSLAPEYKDAVNAVPASDDEYEIVIEEAESGEDESYSEEAGEEEDDEEEWDEEEWDEDYEDEEELVKAIICISIDEETPASVIDEIASQFGLSNMGYDEEFDEYHLTVSEAMTEDALDELIDAIAENENVWCVYWDYADE